MISTWLLYICKWDVIYIPRTFSPRGVTLHINRQGGQWLKKIITPKKYRNSSKNTHCREMGLAWGITLANYIGNTLQNCNIFMIFLAKSCFITLRNTWILTKIPGIWMTPKKYLELKNLDPKNTTGPPVGLHWESTPWAFSTWGCSRCFRCQESISL